MPNNGRGGANSVYMLGGADPPRVSTPGIRGIGGRGPLSACPAKSELKDLEDDCDRKDGICPGGGGG